MVEDDSGYHKKPVLMVPVLVSVCQHAAVAMIWARFLSLARSKLRLCSAIHRAGHFINLACDWMSTVWAYRKQGTKTGLEVSLGHMFGCLERCSAATNRLWTPQTKIRHRVRLIRSTINMDAERNLFPLMIQRRAQSYFDVVIYNGCPCSPWVRLLASRKRHRTFEMATCDTPSILGISLWETPRPEN